MRSLPPAIAVGVAMVISGSVSARVAQEASALATGTRNAIVGHVVDKAGQPVSGVFVTLLQESLHPNGVPRVGIVRMGLGVRTDAAGAYRLESLPLGSFYVVALPENPTRGADGRMNRAGHGITYHPASATRADARQVMVTVREPVVADIMLVPAALAFVSGTVIGQTGQPTGGGTLGVAHGDGLFGVHGRSTTIRPDGSFVLPALPPGVYILQFQEGPVRPLPGTAPQVSGATLAVDGRDLAGIKVAPIHRVRATGRVIIPPEARALLLPAAIRVSGFPVIDGMPGTMGAPITNDDLSFSFEAWPGPNFVRVSVDAPGWVVKAIRYRDADVLKKPIEFKEGHEITGLEVELVRVSGRE
jgi:hypothetical protein